MKFSALRRVPPGLFDNTSSWILKERLLPASSRMNEQKKKGDAFRSAAAEEESSHRSSFPTSTTFFSTPVVLLIIDSFFFFFFSIYSYTMRSSFPHCSSRPCPKNAQRSRFGYCTRTLTTCFVLFFFFLTSAGGTCCRDLYTYHNASLIADQCISMFRRGGKQQRRD